MSNRVVGLAFNSDGNVLVVETEQLDGERTWQATVTRMAGVAAHWTFFAELLDPPNNRTVYVFASVDVDGRQPTALEWSLVSFAEDWGKCDLDHVVLLARRKK